MNKRKVALLIISAILIVPYIIAVTFTCSSNTCSGSDTVTFSDSGTLHQSLLSPITDKFTVSDKSILFVTLFKIADKFVVSDLSKIIQASIVTVTIYITNTVTQIASSNCSGSSCYVNPGATGNELIAEEIIFPVLFIGGVVFGFIYMGIKFFGVLAMITTFIILGLAYIGIIPSYFTLLTIIMIGAALTKIIIGMLGGDSTQ